MLARHALVLLASGSVQMHQVAGQLARIEFPDVTVQHDTSEPGKLTITGSVEATNFHLAGSNMSDIMSELVATKAQLAQHNADLQAATQQSSSLQSQNDLLRAAVSSLAATTAPISLAQASSISTATSGETGTAKWRYGAAVGTRIFFAPGDASSVGVLDTKTDSFSTIPVDAVITGTDKFAGAAVVGTKVYFAPRSIQYIGMVDTVSNAWSHTYAASAMYTVSRRYSGAAAIGTKVVFTPYNEDAVGVLETTTNTFSA